MSALRPPDDDRIPVAAPRAQRRSEREGRKVVDTSPAGLVFIAIIAIIATAGWWLGSQFDRGTSGAIIGGFLGIIAGFAAVCWRWREW